MSKISSTSQKPDIFSSEVTERRDATIRNKHANKKKSSRKRAMGGGEGNRNLGNYQTLPAFSNNQFDAIIRYTERLNKKMEEEKKELK